MDVLFVVSPASVDFDMRNSHQTFRSRLRHSQVRLRQAVSVMIAFFGGLCVAGGEWYGGRIGGRGGGERRMRDEG